MNFTEKLQQASKKNKSLLCVGLDPDPALMPQMDVVEWGRQIIEATKDLVCAYKPNFAFYEALGIDGLNKLEQTLRHIPDNIPVIADAKRGDIGNTARKYAYAIFDIFGFDAARWDFDATAEVIVNYDGDNEPSIVRATEDNVFEGFATILITGGLSNSATTHIRIEMVSNSDGGDGMWIIDNVEVYGD